MNRIFQSFIAVALGGALGTLLRYFINIQTLEHFFPVGTLIENLLGSLLLGFLTGWLINVRMKEVWRLGIGVGFCGGFTTMSTLAADFFVLVGGLSVYWAFSFIIISTFGGVLLAFAGYVIGEKQSFRFRQRVGDTT